MLEGRAKRRAARLSGLLNGSGQWERSEVKKRPRWTNGEN